MENAGAHRGPPELTFDVEVNGRRHRISIRRRDATRSAAGGQITVVIDGRPRAADVTVRGGVWSLILEDPPSGADAHESTDRDVHSAERGGFTEDVGWIDDVGSSFSWNGIRRSYEIAIVERSGSNELTVHVNGRAFTAAVGAGRSWTRRGHDTAQTGNGPQHVSAPMPGKIVKVLVKAGDEVVARQGVVVVEAMKMENELRSPKAGTITEVRVIEGCSVEAGAVLMVVD
jgi:biotin carboxyl carrier protein